MCLHPSRATHSQGVNLHDTLGRAGGTVYAGGMHAPRYCAPEKGARMLSTSVMRVAVASCIMFESPTWLHG
jgi:hypothetical protein